MRNLCYIDTSALAKLVITEAESALLEEWLDHHRPILISSPITSTEIMRAVNKRNAESLMLVSRVLKGVTFVPLVPEILRIAGVIRPVELRSIDAIHVATAIRSGDDVRSIITYDKRMAEAARLSGFKVVSPGADI
ncbi:MAG: type II toxin-antitoxin system VapC family toxin [Scrofimicrobium sp.]